MNLILAQVSTAALVVLLGACAHHEAKSASGKPRSMESRLLKPDMKKGNPFDKEFNTASAGDRGGMKSLGRKGFHTNDVAGLKAFSGTKNYHTNDFSQAGKTSRYQTQDSRFGAQNNRMGDQTFATKKSRYDTSQAHEGTQEFREGTSVYKTDDFGPASKSLKENKRFVFDPSASSGDKPKTANSYSEDDVKRMLGR